MSDLRPDQKINFSTYSCHPAGVIRDCKNRSVVKKEYLKKQEEYMNSRSRKFDAMDTAKTQSQVLKASAGQKE